MQFRRNPTQPAVMVLLTALLVSACGQPSEDEVKAHTNAQDKYCDRLQRDMGYAQRDNNPIREAQLRDEYQRNCLANFR